MTAMLHLHGTARELYDALPVAEETSGQYAWKSVETDGVKITFFPTHAAADGVTTGAEGTE